MHKMKPNFLCVGVQKAGTTTLHDILKQHPDIYLPKLKEAHFFDWPERYKKGIQWWLGAFFGDYCDEKIMGVITPEYLYYEEVPEKIYQDLGGDIKIIIILRNPVDRAYSHYLMSKRRSYETLSFEDAILAEPERIRQGDFERNHFSYIDRGRYAAQLKRYYALFKHENIKVLIFERDIKNNIDETIEEIEAFLGVEQLLLNTKFESNIAREPKNEALNQVLHSRSLIRKIIGKLIPFRNAKRKIKQLLIEHNMKKITEEKAILTENVRREILCNFFDKDIAEVERIIKADLSLWRNKIQLHQS